MSIPERHKDNWATFRLASKAGDVALMECMNTTTDKVVTVVCMVNHSGDDVEFVPFAQLFDGSPYDELLPPAPGGGFATPDKLN